MIFNLVMSGLTMGAIYSLIALGIVMLFKALDLLNCAQGEMVMAGAFFSIAIYKILKVPFPVTFVLTIILVAGVGAFTELISVRPIKKPTLANLIAGTVAMLFIYSNAAMIIGGPETLSAPSVFGDAPIQVMGLSVIPQNLAVLGITFVLMILLQLFFRLTRSGIAMRAVMDDRETASLMGISVKWVVSLTFAISGALGGAAGVLIGPITFIHFDMGALYLLKGFVAAVLGGMYSFQGAVVGGLLFGLIENLSTRYISSGYKDVISYCILLGVLVFRPRGILGEKW